MEVWPTGVLRAAPAAIFAAATLASAPARAAPEFDVYGFGQVDYVQDFMRVNPAWDDTLRPSRIPTTEGQFGSDIQAILSVRQSRFGATATLPVGGNDLSTRFEFDLFGVGVDEGQTTFRLRHAYGEWGAWLGGQTHSLFMDIDVFPNTIDYWGPTGMVFLRNPQIRVTPVRGVVTVAIAIEKPSGDIDAGQIREVDPELGAAITGDDKVPDLTAQIRYGDDETWGHVQVAGIARYIGYETVGGTGDDPSGEELGWGVDVSANFRFGKEKLILSAVYGNGIASYMNDGGTDLAPGGTGADPEAVAVPLFGGVAYFDHTWSDRWTSSLGYSLTWVDNPTFQSADAFQLGQYASANVLYSPVEKVLTGLEVLYGSREDKDGDIGTDVRAQLTFKYSFSLKDQLAAPPRDTEAR